ncbi:hypothetical protein NsoK4_08515 [Nitrosopumilus sp. K4]|uniref:hypothetical protein n=1 Tax=Nitrosopumilus sp. K4 TaxID=2795383 RepID=UPI001BA8C9B7|nr:hypothetical protein [Nitrosopumilus sp. K4]QUC64455.1 hypothetical protein NsoK4_08515 [Nitrosopumilus sp. K4]
MWEKKGLIFKINKKSKWMQTHTALPFIDKINKKIHRIFFSTRDSKNRASIGFIDFDFSNKKILRVSKKPILSFGKVGAFDENGVMGSCIINYEKKKFLYYTGWSSSKTVPFNWSIGLAISKNNGKTFEKISEGPILSKNTFDPYFVGSPSVIIDQNIWKMWYISTEGWKKSKKGLIAPYFLKYAESKDGINWKINKKIIINISKSEKGLGRASIIKENGIYKMWYSYATKEYRIGYAESSNGKEWKRMDQKSGISISKKGWDSKSIEYPYVFINEKKKIMLYNGNEFGKTGFGYAIYSKK